MRYTWQTKTFYSTPEQRAFMEELEADLRRQVDILVKDGWDRREALREIKRAFNDA